MLLGFRKRYHERGIEIFDLQMISSEYVFRGWFVVKLLGSIPFEYVLDSILSQTHYLAYARLSHLLQLPHFHHIVSKKIRGAVKNSYYSLIYLICCFIVLTHWAACAYYTFTRYYGFEENTEVMFEAHGRRLLVPVVAATTYPNFEGWLPSTAVIGLLSYQYSQAMYWSMTMMAGIGRHIYPTNASEVVLTLIVMLTGVFVVSYLITTVGHLMYEINEKASEFQSEMQHLTQLLHHRNTDPRVGARVHLFVRHNWIQQKQIDPNQAMAGLPLQLKIKIMMHICGDMVRKVDMFRSLEDHFVHALISELTFLEIPEGECIFRQNHPGFCMYFIAYGSVEIIAETDQPIAKKIENAIFGYSRPHRYMTTRNRKPENQNRKLKDHHLKSLSPCKPSFFEAPQAATLLKTYHEGEFFGEGALFSGKRSASAWALTHARLFVLSSTSFKSLMRIHPSFAHQMQLFQNNWRQSSTLGIAIATDSFVQDNAKKGSLQTRALSSRTSLDPNQQSSPMPGNSGNTGATITISARPPTSNTGATNTISTRPPTSSQVGMSKLIELNTEKLKEKPWSKKLVDGFFSFFDKSKTRVTPIT